jgi:hypothetical protein
MTVKGAVIQNHRYRTVTVRERIPFTSRDQRERLQRVTVTKRMPTHDRLLTI